MRHDSLIYIYIYIYIVMRGSDEKIDCSDLAVGQAQADQKVIQKSVYFAKRSVSTIRLWQFV